MSFGGFNDGFGESGRPAPMAEINVTPMVDVMLVLLVIFIITAPLFTHAVRLELPRANAATAPDQAITVTVSIDASGTLYWNQVTLTLPALNLRLSEAAKAQPQPELKLRADKSTRYEIIAQVMAAAQTHGINKIGFVTQPSTVATPTP